MGSHVADDTWWLSQFLLVLRSGYLARVVYHSSFGLSVSGVGCLFSSSIRLEGIPLCCGWDPSTASFKILVHSKFLHLYYTRYSVTLYGLQVGYTSIMQPL